MLALTGDMTVFAVEGLGSYYTGVLGMIRGRGGAAHTREFSDDLTIRRHAQGSVSAHRRLAASTRRGGAGSRRRDRGGTLHGQRRRRQGLSRPRGAALVAPHRG